MSKKSFILILVITFFKLLFSFLVWHPDVRNHMDWGEKFWQYGALLFYAPQTNVWSFLWPNQPPGSIYLFALIYKLYKLIFSFFWFVNIKIPLFPSAVIFILERNLYPFLLKLPGILSDLGISYIIYKLTDKILNKNPLRKKIAEFALLLFLLNPIVWYNSAIWGQYDSFVFFLTYLGFYCLILKKPILGCLSFFLSIFTKITPIIFLPIFLIQLIKSNFSFRKYLFAIISAFFLIGVLTYPFSQEEPFSWLYFLYKDKILVEQRQVITSNAFNIWAFVSGIYPISHEKLLGPLTYKNWGYIFYSISFILPLYISLKKKSIKALIWSLSLVSISTFSFLTNMHERYLFSFFPLATILVTFESRLIPIYLALTLINFLNLYNFWWVPDIIFVRKLLSFKEAVFPRILGFIEFLIFLYFYLYSIKSLKFLK